MVHMKPNFRQKAIRLRGQGLSYSEILKQVPVAKSTLSLWLRSVGLTKRQKQRLTKKKLAAAKRGYEKMKRLRIERTRSIKQDAREEVIRLIKDPLWVTGVSLYWAEGTKMKTWRVSERVSFMNMDPKMHSIFIDWIQKYTPFKIEDLVYELYIHESADMGTAVNFWRDKLNIPKDKLRIYTKKTPLKTNRKNTSRKYHGTLRVRVPRSTNLNRRIEGWIEGMIDYLG